MRVLGSSAAWRYIATNSGAMRQYPGRQTYNNRSAENLHTVMQSHVHASILTLCMDKMAFLILETMNNCFYFSVLTHIPHLSTYLSRMRRVHFHPPLHICRRLGSFMVTALDSGPNV